MAAVFFQAPEWNLEENEAKNIAAAAAEVNKHYPLPGIREDHAAIMALVVVILYTYAPRIGLTIARKKAEKNKPRENTTNIFSGINPESLITP
jgi:hypothetical protein